MYDDLQFAQRDFDPNLFIVHIGTNDISLNKTNNEVAEDMVKLTELIKTTSEKFAISNIVSREDNYKSQGNK